MQPPSALSRGGLNHSARKSFLSLVCGSAAAIVDLLKAFIVPSLLVERSWRPVCPPPLRPPPPIRQTFNLREVSRERGSENTRRSEPSWCFGLPRDRRRGSVRSTVPTGPTARTRSHFPHGGGGGTATPAPPETPPRPRRDSQRSSPVLWTSPSPPMVLSAARLFKSMRSLAPSQSG